MRRIAMKKIRLLGEKGAGLGRRGAYIKQSCREGFLIRGKVGMIKEVARSRPGEETLHRGNKCKGGGGQER